MKHLHQLSDMIYPLCAFFIRFQRAVINEFRFQPRQSWRPVNRKHFHHYLCLIFFFQPRKGCNQTSRMCL